MFIQTETTPNPLTLKFIPGTTVMEDGTAFYTDPSAATHSPLAQALFGVNDVRAVFLGNDFVTVTKAENAKWDIMKPALLTAIMEHFVSGAKTHSAEQVKTSTATPPSDDDSEIVKQIRELIDTRVRPAVAMDGGDIIYHSFEDGIVKLELHGSCSGCPSSTATLKNGIENMLKHYVPEVLGVEAVA